MVKRQRFKIVRYQGQTDKLHVARYVWDNMDESERSTLRRIANEKNLEMDVGEPKRGLSIDNSYETVAQTNEAIKQSRKRRKIRKARKRLRRMKEE